MKTCSIDGCTNKHVAKGLCQKHYNATRYFTKAGRDRRTKQGRKYFATAKGKEALKKGSQKRRATKAGASIVENFTHKEIFNRDGYTCCVCGMPIDVNLKSPDMLSISLEHKIPLSKGGNHSLENCGSSHLLCNLRKNSKLIDGNFVGASI